MRPAVTSSATKSGPPAAPYAGWLALLDRDGTIIVEKHYLSDPEGVELVPGAAAAIRALRELGFAVAVVSNQSGVARGYFTEGDVELVNDRVRALLAVEGARIDRFYVCPHGAAGGCGCRKPEAGLGERAMLELGGQPASTVVVGDNASDVGLGRALGALSVLVRTGYGVRTEQALPGGFDLVVDSLAELPEALARRCVAD